MLAQTALEEFTQRASTELEKRIQVAINSRQFETAAKLSFDAGDQIRADELFEFDFLQQGYLTCEFGKRLKDTAMLPWKDVYTAVKYATMGISVITLKKIENGKTNKYQTIGG